MMPPIISSASVELRSVTLGSYLCGKLDWCNVNRVGAEFQRTYNAKVQRKYNQRMTTMPIA